MTTHDFKLVVLLVGVALASCAGSQTTQGAKSSPNDDGPRDEHQSQRGTVEPSEVVESLKLWSGRLSGCIQSAEERGEDPWGGLIVSFEIDSSGDPASIEFVENDAGESAARCVESQIRKAELPAPTGGSVSLRRFYAFSAGRAFETDVEPPETTSSTNVLVLEPTRMIPIAVKSVGEETSEGEASDEKRAQIEFDGNLQLAGPGGYQEAAFESTVRLGAGGLRQCYLNALESRLDAEGRVVTTFRLHEDGSITDVSASSDSFGADFETCFETAIESLVLPPPTEGYVDITKTFELILK